ncbi:hypothetical protein [Solimonas sp. K1W22B-7]|uniref:hypothetical protein n=1 Tax=Solimonas sp. K1W22B-7 TaxID=2303331 RepID=UPI0013C4230D|nr:hypothetical protein [Solimonas sp. K1W22B-7]
MKPICLNPLYHLRRDLRVLLSLGLFAAALGLAGAARASDGHVYEEDASLSVGEGAGGATYTRRLSHEGHYEVQANFRSFSGDPLSLAFRLSPESSRESVQEFGVSVQELDALMEACRARKSCDQEEFNRDTTRYYREHALQLSQEQAGQTPRLRVDVPRVVERNRARVKPVAAALRRLAAEQGRDTEWMMEAAMALVQSGMVYRQPATWDGGRKILGFYPPPRALERGYGDCDTKSALLAAILQNLSNTQLVGVHVPKHYLLGIARTPRSDQAYIIHRGRPFVLVEAAGPAPRRPGQVSEATHTALVMKQALRVDPMF